MMTLEEARMYDFVVENEIATPEELNLAFNLVGNSWTYVIESVLYIRTGYRNISQYIRGEYGFDEDEEEEDEDIYALFIFT